MNADIKTLIEEINDKFNIELSMQVEGILPKGHIYKLGYPCNELLSTGFPNLPIELSSTRLEEKSRQKSIMETKGLLKISLLSYIIIVNAF